MCTSAPSIPTAAPPPAPATPVDPSVQAAAEAERRRQAAQRYSTLLTQGQGAGTAVPQTGGVTPPTMPKSLLGA